MTTSDRLLQRQVVCTEADYIVPEHGSRCRAVKWSTFCRPLTATLSSDSHSAAGRAAVSAQSWSPTRLSRAACRAGRTRMAEWTGSCRHWPAVGVAARPECERGEQQRVDPESLIAVSQVCLMTQPTTHTHRQTHSSNCIRHVWYRDTLTQQEYVSRVE